MRLCIQCVPFQADEPINGGMIRSHELSRAYSEIFSNFEIIRPLKDSNKISVNEPEFLKVLPPEIGSDMRLSFHAERTSIKLAQLMSKDREACIVLEQPWMWELVKRNLRSSNVLVYSSHNLEWRLKQSVLSPYFGSKTRLYVDYVRKLEEEICARADLIIAVTEQEANYYAKFNKSVSIIPNAANPIEGIEVAKEKEETVKYALIIGSAHPPNIKGCLELLDEPDWWIPDDCKLVIVGTLANAMEFEWSKTISTRKVEFHSYLSASDLAEMIAQARVLVLPVSYGAGSSLKTPEALISKKPIVATPQAFRGFEKYAGFPEVYITENPIDFKILILRSLNVESAPPRRNIEAYDLSWESARSQLGSAIRRHLK